MKLAPRLSVPSRFRFRRRHPRLAFGVNGLLFFLTSFQAADGGSPIWSVVLYATLGVVQLIALLRSGRGPLPDTLAYVLAAVGLFATAIPLLGHRSVLPYLYAFAGLVNLARAFLGPEGFRRLVRRPPVDGA